MGLWKRKQAHRDAAPAAPSADPDAPFPDFRYHPDPRSTGSIVESDAGCLACGMSRGYIYTGPAYTVQDLQPEVLCPWCIADGRAAAKFAAHFTDTGVGVPDDVSADVVEEIASRTPGFSTWQGNHWLFHCGDGAAFLGPAGRAELAPHPDAIEVLRH